MTQELMQQKVFREFDMTDPNGVRCDFYRKEGPIASTYCGYLTSVISVELTLAGYQIEDFPKAEKG
jgi:hypothetical protein